MGSSPGSNARAAPAARHRAPVCLHRSIVVPRVVAGVVWTLELRSFDPEIGQPDEL
jgi:hypothetical protein